MQLDYLKEQVAYLKLWQGIVVITDISLTGWLISAVDTLERLRVVLGVFLHHHIERRIKQIGEL